jgi:hypothetical protein
MVEAIEAQIAPLERELRQLARRQTGCKALMGLYGMGELTSLSTCTPTGRAPCAWAPRSSRCSARLVAADFEPLRAGDLDPLGANND